MLTRPEVDKAEAKAETEANSHEARLGQLSQGQGRVQNYINFTFWPHFLQKPKFSGDFWRDLKTFGSKRASTWELY